MRKYIAIFLIAVTALFTVSTALAEDSTTNYRSYVARINGGGEMSGYLTEDVKKYIEGNAVVRCSSLKSNGTTMSSGYGWAELCTRYFGQRATSKNGTVNKVWNDNSRTYVPYLTDMDNVGWVYNLRMRTPEGYDEDVTYTYSGTWSPDT